MTFLYEINIIFFTHTRKGLLENFVLWANKIVINEWYQMILCIQPQNNVHYKRNGKVLWERKMLKENSSVEKNFMRNTVSLAQTLEYGKLLPQAFFLCN
jgi:hypothetical protein